MSGGEGVAVGLMIGGGIGSAIGGGSAIAVVNQYRKKQAKIPDVETAAYTPKN